MHARAVDDAGTHLRELRREEWSDLALAGGTLALAIAATEYAPSLAVPLLIGGLALGALGIRALWRRWDLVDRLAGEPDAYVIAEVLEFAARETTIERRQRSAARIRECLESTSAGRPGCPHDAAEELAQLAYDLEDDELELSPACAVACSRLVNDPAESPLLNPALPQGGIHSTALRIRRGFSRR